MFFALLVAAAINATPAELLESARNAERELQYEAATQTLLELFTAADVSEDELIEGHLLAGSIERVLEHNAEARLHFLYVLRHRVAWVLDDDVPPRVRAFFERVRAEVLQERAHARAAASKPASADAFVVDVPAVRPIPAVAWTGLGASAVVVVVAGALGTLWQIEVADFNANIDARGLVSNEYRRTFGPPVIDGDRGVFLKSTFGVDGTDPQELIDAVSAKQNAATASFVVAGFGALVAGVIGAGIAAEMNE
ncbi:MAG: hypothetical protein Q8O67_19010 [Deltaproteobacteria bacterium]|nr:hypothetical protein [Deltaproteobacteria bacterium]